MKRWFHFSIGLRVTLWTAFVFLLFFVGFGVFVYAYVDSTLRQVSVAILRSHLDEVLSAIEVDNGIVRHPETDTLSTPGTYYAIVDLGGGPTVGTPGMPKIDWPGDSQSAFFRTVSGDTWVFLERPITNDGRRIAVIRAGRDIAQNTRMLGRLRTAIEIAISASILLSLVGAGFLTRRTLSQVDHITRTAEAIGGHDLSVRIPSPPTNDEIGRLSEVFNRMLDRLESAFQRERRFSADAAHELRTPISVILSAAENAERGVRVAEAANAIRSEADRMSKIVSQLLMLARIEAGQQDLLRESVDLSIVVEEVVNSLSESAAEARVRVDVDTPGMLRVTGDQTLLTRAFFNLVENAIRYNVPDGAVTISAFSGPAGCTVIVRDSGVGISPEDLSRVFERFYRTEKPNRPRGSGLGLAVVKAIVDAHEGILVAQSELGSGTRFEVTLPT